MNNSEIKFNFLCTTGKLNNMAGHGRNRTYDILLSSSVRRALGKHCKVPLRNPVCFSAAGYIDSN